eukprot:m.212268 g.212268  ORF g.212268 m.212268 type:complete len:989 (-) comp19950_c0_seq1:273-3239(-)
MATIRLLSFHATSFLRFGAAGLTVDLPNGEWVTVIGPSGSGKSTFIRALQIILQTISDLLEGNEREDILKSLHEFVNTGKQSNGKTDSGSRDKTAFSVAIKWKCVEVAKAFGVFQDTTGNARFCFENDSQSSEWETSLRQNKLTDDNESALKELWEAIMIVPQDHGLRIAHDPQPFCCTKVSLFSNVVDEVKVTDDFKKIYKAVCSVTLKKDKFRFSEQVFERVEGGVCSLAECSGGQWDCFFSLCGALPIEAGTRLHSTRRIVLLDEPGQNLGAHQREILRRSLMELSKKFSVQFIVVTHHVEMLDRASLPCNILRLSIFSNSWSSRDRRRKGSKQPVIAVTKCHKPKGNLISANFWSDVDNLSALFAESWLIVEGLQDKVVLECLSELLIDDTEMRGKVLGENIDFTGLRCKIIVNNGSGNDIITYRMDIARQLNIPYLFLLDFDKIAEATTLRNCLYPAKPTDHTSPVFLLSRMGGHVSATLDLTEWVSKPSQIPGEQQSSAALAPNSNSKKAQKKRASRQLQLSAETPRAAGHEGPSVSTGQSASTSPTGRTPDSKRSQMSPGTRPGSCDESVTQNYAGSSPNSAVPPSPIACGSSAGQLSSEADYNIPSFDGSSVANPGYFLRALTLSVLKRCGRLEPINETENDCKLSFSISGNEKDLQITKQVRDDLLFSLKDVDHNNAVYDFSTKDPKTGRALKKGSLLSSDGVLKDDYLRMVCKAVTGREDAGELTQPDEGCKPSLEQIEHVHFHVVLVLRAVQNILNAAAGVTTVEEAWTIFNAEQDPKKVHTACLNFLRRLYYHKLNDLSSFVCSVLLAVTLGHTHPCLGPHVLKYAGTCQVGSTCLLKELDTASLEGFDDHIFIWPPGLSDIEGLLVNKIPYEVRSKSRPSSLSILTIALPASKSKVLIDSKTEELAGEIIQADGCSALNGGDRIMLALATDMVKEYWKASSREDLKHRLQKRLSACSFTRKVVRVFFEQLEKITR